MTNWTKPSHLIPKHLPFPILVSLTLCPTKVEHIPGIVDPITGYIDHIPGYVDLSLNTLSVPPPEPTTTATPTSKIPCNDFSTPHTNHPHNHKPPLQPLRQPATPPLTQHTHPSQPIDNQPKAPPHPSQNHPFHRIFIHPTSPNPTRHIPSAILSVRLTSLKTSSTLITTMSIHAQNKTSPTLTPHHTNVMIFQPNNRYAPPTTLARWDKRPCSFYPTNIHVRRQNTASYVVF